MVIGAEPAMLQMQPIVQAGIATFGLPNGSDKLDQNLTKIERTRSKKAQKRRASERGYRCKPLIKGRFALCSLFGGPDS
jgi:hypothetical protein